MSSLPIGWSMLLCLRLDSLWVKTMAVGILVLYYCNNSTRPQLCGIFVRFPSLKRPNSACTGIEWLDMAYKKNLISLFSIRQVTFCHNRTYRIQIWSVMWTIWSRSCLRFDLVVCQKLWLLISTPSCRALIYSAVSFKYSNCGTPWRRAFCLRSSR